MIEYHLRPNPLREGLAGDAIRHSEGFFEPPQRSGLGIMLQEEVIEKYRKHR
jgi:L-alanine-DL-glutamate epimerase-like enolase superfamily enzyme